ncbi:metallophosphoesterase family protein [Algibacter mikhailovii]|uniref:Calcineurin-like phosphoesterase domain-containing protein n=1 Tax=Algibacter mikhailovii TaxID=425498 RepID=A0A918QRP6_9FLAO|nr:metallophosphoesterase family protein [Algibacter mikhailovii]GGZ69827.1 hypothetical protein GCM10007028_03650 [Algibacter mikhailovii]
MNLKFLRYIAYILNFGIIILILGCKSHKGDFSTDSNLKTQPWTHTAFDASEEKFSFAVFSDLTGGERENIFEAGVSQINLMRPEFIVNVGDLIEGAEKDATVWNAQWDSFDERAQKAKAPIFYTGGNHDLTGNLAHGIWKERYGPSYYHFIYKNTLFLILDTEDHGAARHDEIEAIRNEAIIVYKTKGVEAYKQTEYANLPEQKWGDISRSQSDYFISVIEDNPSVTWTFLLLHKPIWENPKSSNFNTIEKALNGKNYTVFNGHTHLYKHTKRFGQDYINLATTGGKQFPERGLSFDHFLWVTVDNNEVSLANLKMSGVLDKQGKLPVHLNTEN